MAVRGRWSTLLRMPEEIELLAASAVAAPLLNKLLGPTADYLGGGMKAIAEKAAGNVNAVLNKSLRRLGDGVDDPGGVPPKVLKSVWDEAQLAEDELTQDYLAGVLASSRSENGRDDRAAAHARLVGDLSTYALRTHYLLYAGAQRLYVGRDEDEARLGRFSLGWLFVDFDQYRAGMAFSERERAEFYPILNDTMHTLLGRGLVEDFSFGDSEHLRTRVAAEFPADGGLVFMLSQFGVLLLAVACGIRSDVAEAWVGSPTAFAMEAGPAVPAVVQVSRLPG